MKFLFQKKKDYNNKIKNILAEYKILLKIEKLILNNLFEIFNIYKFNYFKKKIL